MKKVLILLIIGIIFSSFLINILNYKSNDMILTDKIQTRYIITPFAGSTIKNW